MPPPLSIDQTIRDGVQNTYFIRSTHLIAYPLMPPPLQLFTPSSQHMWISTGWFLSSSPPPVPALNLSPALLLLISDPMLSKQLAVAVTMATEIRAPGAPGPHLAAAGSDTDDALRSLRWSGRLSLGPTGPHGQFQQLLFIPTPWITTHHTDHRA